MEQITHRKHIPNSVITDKWWTQEVNRGKNGRFQKKEWGWNEWLSVYIAFFNSSNCRIVFSDNNWLNELIGFVGCIRRFESFHPD